MSRTFRFLSLTTVLASILLGFPSPSYSLVHVDIINGVRKKNALVICVLDGFQDKTINKKVFENAAELKDVVEGDLRDSGFFNVEMGKSAHCNGISAINQENKDFIADLDHKKVNYLAVIDLASSEEGSSILTQIIDIGKENVISEISYQVPETVNLRRLAHFISDSIMFNITGVKGYFNSKIMFISYDGEKSGKSDSALRRKISIMDQDGYGLHDITSSSLVMRPSYVEPLKSIAYVLYNNGLPKVRFLDVTTGRYNDLDGFVKSLDGRVISPKVSPDGKYLVFSLMRNYYTDMFRFDIKTKKIKRLTRGGINVSASFSPDGSKIVYESDISGVQSLHVMNIDGSGDRKITSGYTCAEPSWSPDGEWIAFTTARKRKFYIGIIRPDGSQERLLYNSFLAESPAWSPNSQQVVFSSQNNGHASRHKLKIVSIYGADIKTLDLGISALDPYWFNP